MGLSICGMIGEERVMLFNPSESGQGFLEYGMLLVLVAIIVLIILTVFGNAVGNIFSNVIANV